MRICIYGLGAIGGLLAARIAALGPDAARVSAVARGSTLHAVRRNGLVVLDAQGRAAGSGVHLAQLSEQPAELGEQDMVIVAVKTTALAAVAQGIGPLLGPRTRIVSAMNGIPWWFFHGLREAPAGLRLEAVDPQGAISRAMAPQRVIGCVTHVAANVAEPGTVRQVAGNRFILGEPDGRADSPDVQALADLWRAAGFEVEPTPAVQREIWFKLWGNMTVNPISAMTGATSDRLLDDALVRAFMSRCMREAAAIGARIGLPIEDDPEARHALTRKLGAFRSSMLQDVDAGRAVELDALVGAVLEIARQVEVPTPDIETLFGLARLHARVHGLYPAG